MRTRGLLMVLIVVLSGVLLYLAAFWEPVSPRAISRIEPHSQLQQSASPPGGDFALQGPHGPVALKDYRGKVVLIYFGYTYCPDVCPTSLSLLAQALSELEAGERQRVQAIFVSLDPERDTPARLKDYAPFFHPGLIGLTGTSQQIATVARQYGAKYQKQPPNADGQYAVDHSSVTYVVDAQGRLAAALPHGQLPAQIVATIRQQLASAAP